MLRSLKAVAALAAAGAGLATVAAEAQWGHGDGFRRERSHFHAPYGGRSSSYGYAMGPRYSLYAPAYSPVGGPTYGYQMAYPSSGLVGYPSGMLDGPPAYGVYGSAPGYGYPVAPTYGDAMGYGSGYGMMGRPHGKLEYDVYGPDGRKQEVEYHYDRDGRVRVDVDD